MKNHKSVKLKVQQWAILQPNTPQLIKPKQYDFDALSYQTLISNQKVKMVLKDNLMQSKYLSVRVNLLIFRNRS